MMKNETKKCTICLIDKDLLNFYQQFVRNSKGEVIKTYTRPACKNCANKNQLQYSTAWKKKVNYTKTLNRQRLERRAVDVEWRDKINTQKREQYRNTLEYQLYGRAKQRALKNSCIFDITPEDIIIPKYCKYLGVLLEVGNKEFYQNSPSLDRIDPTKGYTKDNIQVISTRANTMKSSATVEQLRVFCTNVLKDINKDDIVRTVSKDIEVVDKELLR